MPRLDLDRAVFGRIRLEPLLHLVLLGATVLLRVLWLDNRPLHHDESIHAYYSWRILTVGPSDYRYDPTYHGPTLYYLTAFFQMLLGPSDFSSRALPVACGAGLVALAWPLRPLLGRREALAFAALLALSPTVGYYSRSLRHDVPMAFFTLAAAVAFLRFAATRRKRLAYAAGALVGLASATKEDIYLTALVMANVLWMVGFLAGASGRERLASAKVWARDVAAFVGRSWAPLLTAILIALSVYVVFYTSLLTHPENWNATTRALRYWWGQQQSRRIGGPWWYYLPLEIVYEPLIFLPALVVLFRWTAAGAPSRVHAFFVAWTILAFAVYAWAQEKVPWLLVPVLVPQAALAASFFASEPWARLRWWLPLAVFGVWSFVAPNYLYDAPRTTEPAEASHNEPLVYVQSTYDVPKLVERVESVAGRLGTGKRTPMVVKGEPTWPLSWYLREYPVHWGSLPAETDAPILIVDPQDAKRLARDLEAHYEQSTFAVRGWWQIEWSRATPANVARFLVYRLAWNPQGTTDGAIFVRRDLSGRPAAKVRLTPAPPTREYVGTPLPISPTRAIGGPATFQEPRGLAFDASGRLLVADTKHHRIVVVGADGRILEPWGGPDPGDGPRQFRDPCGVAVAPDGSIYVADTWNHRIQKLDSAGGFVGEWREENPAFWGPRAVAVSPDGAVFVADTGNKRVLAYDGNGKRLATIGAEGSEDGQFIEPVGLAIDPEKSLLYVADTGNHRIQFFAFDGAFRGKWTVHGWQEFYTEPYIAWRAGTIWATDSFNHRVNAYDPSGRLVRSLGGPAGEVALNRPIGIAVSPAGELYVSDTMNHRVVALANPPGGPQPP